MYKWDEKCNILCCSSDETFYINGYSSLTTMSFYIRNSTLKNNCIYHNYRSFFHKNRQLWTDNNKNFIDLTILECLPEYVSIRVSMENKRIDIFVITGKTKMVWTRNILIICSVLLLSKSYMILVKIILFMRYTLFTNYGTKFIYWQQIIRVIISIWLKLEQYFNSNLFVSLCFQVSLISFWHIDFFPSSSDVEVSISSRNHHINMEVHVASCAYLQHAHH